MLANTTQVDEIVQKNTLSEYMLKLPNMRILTEKNDFWSFACHSMLGGKYTCIITPELADQHVSKALFTCVAFTNIAYQLQRIMLSGCLNCKS